MEGSIKKMKIMVLQSPKRGKKNSHRTYKNHDFFHLTGLNTMNFELRSSIKSTLKTFITLITFLRFMSECYLNKKIFR